MLEHIRRNWQKDKESYLYTDGRSGNVWSVFPVCTKPDVATLTLQFQNQKRLVIPKVNFQINNLLYFSSAYKNFSHRTQGSKRKSFYRLKRIRRKDRIDWISRCGDWQSMVDVARHLWFCRQWTQSKTSVERKSLLEWGLRQIARN
jgi:hypothetical protein